MACLLTMSISCAEKETEKQEEEMQFTGAENEVKLMTLDPGHFHSALVQKTMYKQISPKSYVYAPEGPDVQNHLRQIELFNKRQANPTNWQVETYTADDYLEKMLRQKPGNVVVLAGNNRKKAEYIHTCIDAGLNVLSDKPMCINADGFKLLLEAFELAKQNDVLLYDIMTERFSTTTILQKELVNNKAVFGELKKGSIDDPAVTIQSVHHFFKYVAGNPIKRPGWYFDTTQQGEGLVDVTTHLTDIVMWACFPEQIIDYHNDIEMKRARRWATIITPDQFRKVTQLSQWPEYLRKNVNENNLLKCYANGEMIYTLKGIHAKVVVKWNYQAPEGAKDTHFCLMKGTQANVIIRQGKEQNYKPEVYVEAAEGADAGKLDKAIKLAVASLAERYPGLAVEKQGDKWHLLVPDKHRIGHEAHFRQVTEHYLKYLAEGELPEWEVPNMKAKYYTTTSALELAEKGGEGVEFVKSGDKIYVNIDGKPLTVFRFAHDFDKPILYPVRSPSGIRVTRGYPFMKIEGESDDHPHHTGVYFTYDIGENKFWAASSEDSSTLPRIRHVEIKKMRPGPKGTISTVAHWVGKSGDVLLKENRDMTFSETGDEYVIDFDIDLTAQDAKVEFGDTKEGMFAIRVAHWLREDRKSAEYLNSEGQKTADNVWGKRAKWVRLQGQKQDKTVGIAIFHHPDSVNYPTYWHARAYGLFAANPLGQAAFEKGLGVKEPKTCNFTLKPGQSGKFKFRMIIYEGTRNKKQLDSEFEEYAAKKS